jgi:hypothetical protein
MSGVHRVGANPAARSFSVWVSEQLAVNSAPKTEVERLEARLRLALQARDVPAALLHACAIAYLDPGHKTAKRIKRRCAREMRREAARGARVLRMAKRWSDLRDESLSSEELSVLSCIDGKCSLEEVVGLTGLPAAAAHDAVERLMQDGIVSLDPDSQLDR